MESQFPGAETSLIQPGISCIDTSTVVKSNFKAHTGFMFYLLLKYVSFVMNISITASYFIQNLFTYNIKKQLTEYQDQMLTGQTGRFYKHNLRNFNIGPIVVQSGTYR